MCHVVNAQTEVSVPHVWNIIRIAIRHVWILNLIVYTHTEASVPRVSNSIYGTIRHMCNYYLIVNTRNKAFVPLVSNSICGTIRQYIYIYICKYLYVWIYYRMAHVSNSIYTTIRHVFDYYRIVYTRIEVFVPHVSKYYRIVYTHNRNIYVTFVW